MKLFISHSSKNKEIVKLFVYFLESLDPKIKTFCTSMKSEFNAGDNFISQIVNGLKDSDLFLPVISEEYLASKFCIMELGAAWIKFSDAKKDVMKYIIPAVLYPVPASALLDTPLHDLQVAELTTEAGVVSLVSSIHQLGMLSCDVNEYKQKVPDFVSMINEVVFSTNSGNLIRRAKILSISENDNPKANVIDTDLNNNVFTIHYELTQTSEFSTPKFISLVMQFIKKLNLNSVVHAVEKNTSFRFNIDNSDSSIKRLAVEFKFGDNNRIIESLLFSIKPGINTFKINFSMLNQDGWDEVSEICFVVRPIDVIDSVGTFKITNIEIDKD